MARAIPTTPDALKAEIASLLSITSQSTDRGRLFHLLNALVELGGGSSGGGTGAPSTALELGEYTTVGQRDHVVMGEAKCFFDSNSVTFPHNRGGENIPQAFTFLYPYYDFDILMCMKAPDGSYSDPLMYVGTSIHQFNSPTGYTLGFYSPMMMPPPPTGSEVKLTVVPKPKGSGEKYTAMGTCILTVPLTIVDASSMEDFKTKTLSETMTAGVDNTAFASISQIYVKDGFEQTKIDQLMNRASHGLFESTVPCTLVFYQNGEVIGQCLGTGGGGTDSDLPNSRVFHVGISNRGAPIGAGAPIDLTQGAVELRMYI